MNQSDDQQQQIEALNALVSLTPTEVWRPTLGAEVQAFHLEQWVEATLLQMPNNHPDPKQRISGWKIRLPSGHESYVWKVEHLSSPDSKDLAGELPF